MPETIIRRSGFVHLLDLTGTTVLAVHAISQMRITLTHQVADLVNWFDQPRVLDDALPALAATLGADEATILSCINLLLDQGVLTRQSEAAETSDTVSSLTPTYGRDPTAVLDQYRRARMQGADPYWSVEAPRGLGDAKGLARRIDVLVLGDCDVQMETDFLRQEAARRGIDLRAAASFAADTGLAGERPHDLILIGALQARHAIVIGDPEHHNNDPSRVYIDAVETMLRKLRAHSQAPILIDGLPEPTVQPLGFADRGMHSHRNRFRQTNLALARMAEEHADVHIVDVAAALGAAGSASLLDDGLVSFTHFGSMGWMLQRPDSELAAVHNQFPDRQPLADAVGGDPYRRETVMARAHMDMIGCVLGLERKKCVIVDLDGVLWPGVLAETGKPFAWTPEIGGSNSFIGLYFGIHEALRMLQRRGILLACVSKNDEATVRALWRYEQHYPRQRLLNFNHFVTARINWQDKAANIQSIADELGFPLNAFLFIDDMSRERERIRQSLPDVGVLGEDLFSLRRILLTDPRLQPPRITEEAAQRTTLVRAQLDRSRLRAEVADEGAFTASLEVLTSVERLTASGAGGAVLERVRELITRTTQFNATDASFTLDELRRIIERPDGRVFVLRMSDRLADHGLVGVAVVANGEILNFVMSCRVIGLGGERALLEAVAADPGVGDGVLTGRIVQTDRNIPVRHLYADNGFTACEPGVWVRPLGIKADQPSTPVLETTADA